MAMNRLNLRRHYRSGLSQTWNGTRCRRRARIEGICSGKASGHSICSRGKVKAWEMVANAIVETCAWVYSHSDFSKCILGQCRPQIWSLLLSKITNVSEYSLALWLFHLSGYDQHISVRKGICIIPKMWGLCRCWASLTWTQSVLWPELYFYCYIVEAATTHHSIKYNTIKQRIGVSCECRAAVWPACVVWWVCPWDPATAIVDVR